MVQLNHKQESEGREEFKAIRPGWYGAYINNSELKPTSNGNGQFLLLEIVIVDEGEYKGRKIFDRLNLINPNAQAVEIAKKTLDEIIQALKPSRNGANSFNDTAELHNHMLLINVSVTPATERYSEGNNIKKYWQYLDPSLRVADFDKKKQGESSQSNPPVAGATALQPAQQAQQQQPAWAN